MISSHAPWIKNGKSSKPPRMHVCVYVCRYVLSSLAIHKQRGKLVQIPDRRTGKQELRNQETSGNQELSDASLSSTLRGESTSVPHVSEVKRERNTTAKYEVKFDALHVAISQFCNFPILTPNSENSIFKHEWSQDQNLKKEVARIEVARIFRHGCIWPRGPRRAGAPIVSKGALLLLLWDPGLLQGAATGMVGSV